MIRELETMKLLEYSQIIVAKSLIQKICFSVLFH